MRNSPKYVREFVVFKASENVVEGGKVLDVVILP
jgi:hypothetical protein